MLHLTEIEKQWITAPCAACMEKGEKGRLTRLCSSCKGYIETSYKCPHCDVAGHFHGIRTPGACIVCKKLLPNLSRLKVSLTVRTDYHLDKEIYV